ncbi:hypothetical protein FMEXI_4328 [Fusarium mexicanum]|uniref:Uncharacterized protein n=1 Tax=Fusarium mexicanum TaxID=751941 RepID=A0A8H5J702_9HYPO|nr:hypothetical protein FMEXI_4328 [Fusarium mexicanum]
MPVVLNLVSDAESDMPVIRPTVPKHQTDKNYIRGKHIEDLIGDNAVRVNWSDRDRMIMSSHLAKYRLNKGNLKQVKIREILHRLGLLEYSLADTSMSYHSVCVAKITSALEYRLKRLHEDGHVMATFTKPYKAQWKPYTRAWGEDDWDGNTSFVVPLESDSITSSENSDGQDLAQRMAQLSINTEQGFRTASAEAQDQQRLHQEQQRLATEQELAREREERLQMAQQRLRQELLHREQLKREYQRQQEKVARQRDNQTKHKLQQQQQQQQSTLLAPRKGLSISEWAIGVNSPELMPEDSLSSREWEPAHSRFYMEQESNPTDRYLPSKKSVVCAMPETIPTPIQPISTTAAPIESITVKEDIDVMQNSHQKWWMQQVTALAWTIRVHKVDSRYDTSSLQDQLRRNLEEGSPWSTFGVMIGKLCL